MSLRQAAPRKCSEEVQLQLCFEELLEITFHRGLYNLIRLYVFCKDFMSLARIY